MAKRRIIYTNKKHPKRSIMSFILGVISIVSVWTVITLTYKAGGVSMPGYGLTGFLAAVFSLIGLGLGISGIRIRESFKLVTILGILLNALMIIGLIVLLYLGR